MVIADSSTKRPSTAWLITCARVVLPVPGGPQRITELVAAGPREPLTRRRSGEPSLSSWRWPHDLVQGARAHPHGERGPPGLLGLAFLGGCGEEVRFVHTGSLCEGADSPAPVTGAGTAGAGPGGQPSKVAAWSGTYFCRSRGGRR